MFKVQNADFIADKLAAELLPDQEFREVLVNSLEAVQRRMTQDSELRGGRIEFDVDWTLHKGLERWYISCADNGDGMSRAELARYTTTLAVIGANQNQSLRGNQGMGLKISGPTRHKKGLLIRTLKEGERTAVQIGWDGSEYGLIPIGANDEFVIQPPAEGFPALINDHGSGTVVTFLGNDDDSNTFVPDNRPKSWLFKYLNTRFFRLSNDEIEVVVRVPSGEEDDWPHSRAEADQRMRGQGKSFNLQNVYGTGTVWDQAADKLSAGEHRGIVVLAGDAPSGIPQASLHWWILPPAGQGSDVSSRTHSGGSFAVLFQNELHDWKTGNPASPFFARLGVLFGKSRICFVLEPLGTTVSSDFARAHVLVNGERVLDSECWLMWCEQFKRQIPDAVARTMAEEQARLQAEDPDRVRRINDRLQEVMQLLRPRRFKRAQAGRVRAGGPSVIGPGTGEGSLEPAHGDKPATARSSRGRGVGAVLSELDDASGTPAIDLRIVQHLEPRWVSEDESETLTIVKGNANGLRDRAAALAGTDGRSAGILLLNREFRGYQAILAAINDWANPEGDDDKVARIESITQEWIEQKMIEAVQGLRQLENGRTWITEHYDEALSPVALTAAFMADRYHTLREVRRAVGTFKSRDR